ncbi:MAG TPA: hypothetical protein VGO80_03940 [Solirubrobacteraceae bacterium]|nr:hypothetical protein [Solirubrobacteraceae bacterium]
MEARGDVAELLVADRLAQRRVDGAGIVLCELQAHAGAVIDALEELHELHLLGLAVPGDVATQQRRVQLERPQRGQVLDLAVRDALAERLEQRVDRALGGVLVGNGSRA